MIILSLQTWPQLKIHAPQYRSLKDVTPRRQHQLWFLINADKEILKNFWCRILPN